MKVLMTLWSWLLLIAILILCFGICYYAVVFTVLAFKLSLVFGIVITAFSFIIISIVLYFTICFVSGYMEG